MPDIRPLTGTSRRRPLRRSVRFASVAVAAVLATCGGDDPGLVEPEPDPEVEPFVGTWDADVYTITSVEDTTVVADIIEIGGSFTLNVQPSGTYTATLVFSDGESTLTFVEIGQLSVSDDFITLAPSQPPGDPSTASYTFLDADHLRLEGPTEFDFNFDDQPEQAEAFIEIRRR